MKTSSALVTLLTVLAHVEFSTQTCKGNGFEKCRCNFVGGCDVNGNPTIGSTYSIAPQNIWQFAYDKGYFPGYAFLCERGNIAILYDCNARIPLYAATEIKTGIDPRSGRFHPSSVKQLHRKFQAKNSDYAGSSKNVLCYEDRKTRCFQKWYGPNKCPYTEKQFSRIDKGHMIAARYASNYDMMYDTFSYTNAVPQFGAFNRGAWAQAEKYIRAWGVECQAKVKNGMKTRVFIVVGAIPSTRTDRPRFYGAPGFSNFEGESHIPKNGEYRIVVPYLMWTAACCTLADNYNKVISVTAFARENSPNKNKVRFFKSPQLMLVSEVYVYGTKPEFINLFPANAKCMGS